jgi:hypothetical protein
MLGRIFMVEYLFGAVHMTTDLENPYAPPGLHAGDRARGIPWHIVPAAASFLIGAASSVVGLFAVAGVICLLWTHQAGETLGGMIAGCSLYLGFGVSWMTAGYLYWQRRYRRGLIATGFGILIPVVLFAVLGF